MNDLTDKLVVLAMLPVALLQCAWHGLGRLYERYLSAVPNEPEGSDTEDTQ